MPIVDHLIQTPAPEERLRLFRGDIITFQLVLEHPERGKAFLRTNIGHAEIKMQEIIKSVHDDSPPLGRDWFDVPMTRLDETRFQVVLPLCEIGHFEAKAFFLPENEQTTLWPPGSNTVINVSPADTCCGNIIYNAFVRQFGPNKAGGFLPSDRLKELDEAGYSVIPPSGVFRDLIKELDFIFNRIGCRIIQLLPIHPTPTTYGRLGRYGSPYAALSFTAVDPALAEFDPKATPLEQFIELVDAVHAHHAKIFIDIAVNHTGWAAELHESHPQWLVRGPEGRIEAPGAWGVTWEDLTKLDYTHTDLWQYTAEVFLTWCRRGVDGFRCDAGYMIPIPAWEYMIARVREQFPDTIFFLEGLGGKMSVTRKLLDIAGFDWAYSELFQNYDRGQVDTYLPESIDISDKYGLTLHYAETHDNPRLASRSIPYAKMRTAMCALFSQEGGFGFANGVEWYATEKINVHESPSLNWGAEINQVAEISRLNAMLKRHPAFFDRTDLKLIQQAQGNFIVLLRYHEPTGKKLVVAVNLDDQHPVLAKWTALESFGNRDKLWDLLTEQKASIRLSDGLYAMDLAPAQVCCLTADFEDIELVRSELSHPSGVPNRINEQDLRAAVLDIFRFYNKMGDLKDFDIDEAVSQLKADPIGFCRQCNTRSDEPRVITWNWPRDIGREVMIPPEHFLLLRAERPFRAQIAKKDLVLRCGTSLFAAESDYFILFSPLETPKASTQLDMSLCVYTPEGPRRENAPILLLSEAKNAALKTVYTRKDFNRNRLSLLGVNGTGGMMKIPLKWGELDSRYDALLSANFNPDTPADRWIMLTRCRIWLVFQGYSRELNDDCLERFILDEDLNGIFCFRVPTGRGRFVELHVTLQILAEKNHTKIIISRISSGKNPSGLPDADPVQLIMRPDIESRSAHAATKAYQGPEKKWPGAVTAKDDRFRFQPDPEHMIDISVYGGVFVQEPEWHYMVHRRKEADRGFDPDSDLFSPGYFSVFLEGGKQLVLSAEMTPLWPKSDPTTGSKADSGLPCESDGDLSPDLMKTLKKSLNQFVVKRGTSQTVIAGYPWFLDWGRDSLIVSRGLIAAGEFDTALSVIKLFAQFEKDGTLPNMIQADDTRNRDTSDAPLWLFTACNDFKMRKGSDRFLDESIGDRSLRQILISIGCSLISGTQNGIRMDPESGLIYSPIHFTWMDTNHPAGTPREGYPIEIQALWFAGLELLSEIDKPHPERPWKQLARQVRASMKNLFFLEGRNYLSDCLHAEKGISAFQAEPDDALRPNQLLAVTLGAVEEDEMCRGVIHSCEELLVPGAIRSLANRPISRPLEIVHNGKLLVDPHHPFQGTYLGDEDSQRKPAYHNGTAWTWQFPLFCEAWGRVYGDKGKKTALSWLASMVRLINSGCVGHVPEILDGDFPHTQRGCDAQAWGISEFIRVWTDLQKI